MRLFAIRFLMLSTLVGLFMMNPDAGIAALVCGFGYVAVRRAQLRRQASLNPQVSGLNFQSSSLSEV